MVVYDVVDDKRRTKLSKYLESIGDRVQKSVFEIYLTPQELEKLLKRLEKFIEKKEDSVRVYFLCETCRGKVRNIGQGKVTSPPGVVII